MDTFIDGKSPAASKKTKAAGLTTRNIFLFYCCFTIS